MNENQLGSNNDENNVEIIELDAHQPHRFSSTSALRRGMKYIGWSACMCILLLLVILVNPLKALPLLSGQNHQPYRTVAWVSGHNVFLVTDQAVIYIASYDGIVAALRSSDGHLLWRVPTNGPMSGKPVIVGGVVYASSATTLYAINSLTGKLLWFQTPEESLLDGQPIVGGGIVSIALANGSIAAWRASDGRLLWDVSLKYETMFPVAITDGMILADTSHGSVVALRTMNGLLVWKQTAMKFAPPLPQTGGSVEISVAVPFTASTSLQQSADGKLLWRHDFSATALKQSGDIATSEGSDLVFVNQQQSGDTGGSLTVLRANTGKLLWQCATGIGFIPPLDTKSTVFIGSQYGQLNARRTYDGVSLWHYTPQSYPIVEMMVAQTSVYLGSETGTVESLAADTGTLRWRFNAAGPISDVTQETQGAVLIGAGNGIISSLREDTGTLLWHSSPLV
jgi:outer membrane protein assembly factor BamB